MKDLVQVEQEMGQDAGPTVLDDGLKKKEGKWRRRETAAKSSTHSRDEQPSSSWTYYSYDRKKVVGKKPALSEYFV